MRGLAVFALCVVGVIARSTQEPGWDESQTYTYDVEGHVISGFGGSNQNQNQGRNGQLELGYQIQVTKTRDDAILLKPKNFRLLKNCRTQCEETENTVRADRLSPDLLQYLEAPIELNIRNGKVVAFRVQENLPVWVVNIKKSQAAPFGVNQNAPAKASTQIKENTVYGQCKVQYKVQEGNQQDEDQQQPRHQQQQQQQRQQQQQQQQRQQQQQHQQDDDDNSSSQEEDDDDSSKGGILSRIASYFPGMSSNEESSQESAQKKFCNRNDQVFQILRTVTVSNCENPPFLPNNTQQAQQQANLQNRVVVTRYLACGPSRQNYQIVRIDRQEQTRLPGQPRNVNQDAVELVQKIVLKDVSSAPRKFLDQKSEVYEQLQAVYVNMAYSFNTQALQPFQQPYGDQPEIQQQLKQAQQQRQQQQQQSQQQDQQQQAPQPNSLGQISLYQETFFKGQSTMIDLQAGHCYNLPKLWNDMANSIDTGVVCVIAFEEFGCSTGNAIRLERFTFGSQNLELVKMNRKISSLQLCHRNPRQA